MLLGYPRSRIQVDFHGNQQLGSQFLSLLPRRCYVPHAANGRHYSPSCSALDSLLPDTCSPTPSYLHHHKLCRRKTQQISTRSTELCLSVVLTRESVAEQLKWLFCSLSSNLTPTWRNFLGEFTLEKFLNRLRNGRRDDTSAWKETQKRPNFKR